MASLGHHRQRLRFAQRNTHARKHAGEKRLVLVIILRPATGCVPVDVLMPMSTIIQRAFVRKSRFILQSDPDRSLAHIWIRLHAEFFHRVANAQGIALVEIEINIDGHDIVHSGQLGVAADADHVADIHQMTSDASAKRCGDMGVTEIQLGQIELRLRLVALALPALDIGHGGGVLFDHFLLAVKFRLRPEQLRLRNFQLLFVRFRLDDEEQLVRFDKRAILEN